MGCLTVELFAAPFAEISARQPRKFLDRVGPLVPEPLVELQPLGDFLGRCTPRQ